MAMVVEAFSTRPARRTKEILTGRRHEPRYGRPEVRNSQSTNREFDLLGSEFQEASTTPRSLARNQNEHSTKDTRLHPVWAQLSGADTFAETD